MDLRQLKYFVKIVEQRSMSRASVELNVAQSALSLQISTLETRLRQKLLIRRSTGVSPTQAGQTLYKHAVAILRQVERAAQDVERSAADVSGPASLGLPVVLQDLLQSFGGSAHANAPSEVSSGRRYELPLKGDGATGEA